MSSCKLMIFGKGYSVTRASGELQVLLPNSLEKITSPQQKQIADSGVWASVFQNFYSVPPSITLRKKYLALTPSEITTISISSTEDNLKRPSAVAVVATTAINWEIDEIERIVSISHRIAMRTALHLGELFRTQHEIVEAQLRSGILLLSDTFDFAEEEQGIDDEWASILEEIRKWDGIKGIGDGNFLSLGGNVLIGTANEARSVLADGNKIDGYFDPRTKTIVPLNDGLKLFPPAPTPITEPEQSITAQIQQVQKTIDTLSNNFDAHHKESRGDFLGLRGLVEDGVERVLKFLRKNL